MMMMMMLIPNKSEKRHLLTYHEGSTSRTFGSLWRPMGRSWMLPSTTVAIWDMTILVPWNTRSGIWLCWKPLNYFGIWLFPIESMYGIYANIGGILMVNVTIYTIHGSYGFDSIWELRGVHLNPMELLAPKNMQGVDHDWRLGIPIFRIPAIWACFSG